MLGLQLAHDAAGLGVGLAVEAIECIEHVLLAGVVMGRPAAEVWCPN
jgi:hypothetical protein